MTDDPTTDDYDTSYDRVTARDIAEFLHHLAELRCGARGDDRTERAAFLTRKAELFTRIADQAARPHPDPYTEQVRQMATDARTAAEHIEPQLPHQRVGPDHRRTPDRQPDAGGARSQEKTGASSG